MDWAQVFASRQSRMKASEIRELLKLLDQPDILSFAGGIPDPALFPTEAFSDAFADVFSTAEGQQALQYSVSEGYKPLREWLAGQMGGIGIPCDIDNILITSGSQQALDYLGKLFLSPNDTALVTWPTYMGALGAFNAYEPHYDRLDPASNRTADDYRDTAAANGGAVKFAYASVDFANPTGMTMNRRERQGLLDLSEALDIPFIEDAAYQSLRYDGEPQPSVLAMEIEKRGTIEDCRTIYCGSFSKTLAPGLRVGWVVAAKEVIQRLVLIKQAADLHSASLNQIAINRVARTTFGKQVELIQKTYKSRRDHMLAALEREMPDNVSWTHPEGGMFIWVTLPQDIDGADLLAESLKTEKFAFVPGRAFYADSANGNGIRLSFSCALPDQIDDGIGRLGRLIRQATTKT